jgi:hypothetical protein
MCAKRITPDRMLGVLGPAAKPEVVWEKQFDYNDDALAALARTDWDKIDPLDLAYFYLLDLTYVEPLQPDLFRHLFPACLKFWYDTLMADVQAGYLTSGDFHHALVHGQVMEKMLSPGQCQALVEFFRDGMLDRFESQPEFLYDPEAEIPNGWIFRFNTLGIVAPVIPSIWDAWWRLDHPGKAFCAVMYGSGLVYERSENPVYRIATGTDWRGPFLSSSDGGLDGVWRSDNLACLSGTLSPLYVTQKLEQAAAMLSDHPGAELAARVADDAKARKEIIEIQIASLLEDLAGQRHDRHPPV